MIERNSIVKNEKNISDSNAKNFAENSLALSRNRKKTKRFHSVMTSITCLPKSKPI